MKKKIKALLKKMLIKKTTVDTFEIDGICYKVMDTKSPIPRFKNERWISFANNGRNYSYSAIYTNPKYHVQPIFPVAQKLVEIWGKRNRMNTALVLGCAGCSMPRFLGLHYPNSKITGVELSGKLIEIAHKHFLLDQIKNQFTLLEGDAIAFVKNKTVQKQDVIFVDIFAGEQVVREIFSNEFLSAAYDIASEAAMVMINVLGEDADSLQALCDTIEAPFARKHFVRKGGSMFLCLIKGTGEKAEQFESDLRSCEELTVVF